MNILITGASGMMGGILCDHLLRIEDIHLFAVARQPEAIANEPWAGSENLSLLKCDLSEAKVLLTVLDRLPRIDAVIHLAANLRLFASKGVLKQANIEPTVRLFEYAKRAGCNKFIYASSIEAAGSSIQPMEDSSSPYTSKPRNNYGWSKAQTEKLILGMKTETSLTLSILRIGSVIGQERANLVSEVADSLINHGRLLEFLPVFGNRTIQPVFIDDVVRVISLLLDGSAGQSSPFITVAESPIRILDFFSKISETLGTVINFRRDIGTKEKLFLNAFTLFRNLRGEGGDFSTYALSPPFFAPNRVNTYMQGSKVISGFQYTPIDEVVETSLRRLSLIRE